MKSKIKTFFKSFAVAFSIYSKIPMPTFKWGSDDMKYHFCFFPWVGAIIGIILYDWNAFAYIFAIDKLLYITIAIAIPLIITGGFHVDGFMDTMDAIHSYQDREKRLEILKDPHIGAFSVISVIGYFLIFTGCMAELSQKAFYVFCFSFFLSRVLSGLSVMIIRPAKKDGMLNMFSTTAEKNTVKIALLIQGLICMALMIIISPLHGLVAIGAAVLSVMYYIHESYSKFGGITGDLAGFFVCICELSTVVLLAFVSILFY